MARPLNKETTFHSLILAGLELYQNTVFENMDYMKAKVLVNTWNSGRNAYGKQLGTKLHMTQVDTGILVTRVR